MTDTPKPYDEVVSELQQLRDELRVQIHLGSKEAQEEYEKLEQKWDELMQEGQPLADAVSETAENVGAAVELAAGELKQGYEKIRDLLK